MKIYALPPLFYDDHRARDFPEDQAALSRIERQTKRQVFVALDDVGYDELMADARYYAEEMGAAGFDGVGLISSARATVKALVKQGRPESAAVRER